MPETSTNLIELIEGNISNYKVSTEITYGNDPIDKNHYVHAKIFLGSAWLYILKDLPEKSILKFNIENHSAKTITELNETIVVQYLPTNPFMEILSKVDDGIGFYGNFKVGNKSSRYNLANWKVGVYKP